MVEADGRLGGQVQRGDDRRPAADLSEEVSMGVSLGLYILVR